MLNGGSLRGTLTAMHSRTMEAILPQDVTLDVHLPFNVHIVPGPGGLPIHKPLGYSPAVAQATLNHFTDESEATALVISILTVDSKGLASDKFFGDQLTNSVYAANMARATFRLFARPSVPIGSERESSWCMALANVFQFSLDSLIDPTEHPPPPEPVDPIDR